MYNFATMRKHFNLGSGRVSIAQKIGSVYKIKILEIVSDKRYIDFSIVGWASIVRANDEAQKALYEMHTNPQLKLRYHIGGGYYISVSADFKFIDIR